MRSESTPPFKPTSARSVRAAGLLVAALLAAGSTGLSAAHDWVSPTDAAPAARRPVPPRLPPQEPVAPQAWPGMLWAGPASGAPAAPNARDCQRAPQTQELAGIEPPQRQARRHGRADESVADLAMRPAPSAAAKSAREAEGASSGLRERELNLASRSVVPAAPADAATESRRPSPRPEAVPVTAGVVDDNADFGSYLAYRQRNAHLPVRARDVTERHLLTVHDAAGRPVPDAEVTLHAGGRELPLWARTDAGGQVWLHPAAVADRGLTLLPVAGQAGAPGVAELPALIEVQVRRGNASGRAILKRGQRDGLQVRLDRGVALERARLDLVFLVDATGSMADEIDKLKRSMRAMADQIAQLPSRPDMCFALVAYRDRGDAYFVRATDFSADLSGFQRSLASVQAGGGGDTPEALNEALHTAVHRLSWRGDGATRLVVLVADAPPHLDYGTPTYDEDMQGALARGIKLFAVGASGLDPTGEYVFRQAAQYTGGRFVFLTYADARDPSSGPGRETVHEVQNYSVESLDRLVVRLVREELARRPTS